MESKYFLEKAIKEVILELGIKKNISVILGFPQNIQHGNYTSNIAFIVAKLLKRSPTEIGNEIKQKIVEKVDFVSHIEIVEPGFMNIYFTEEYIISQINQMLIKDEKVGMSDNMKNKKIMIEYTDPNPFKEFHIGHLYNNIVGESIARLFESQGAIVKRACYQGDVGLHVAKAIWGMMKLSKEMPQASDSLNNRANFMGKAYALGANAYEENIESKNEIITINKNIYLKDNSKITEIYNKGREWSLDYFALLYDRLGSNFDKFYFESEVVPIGLEFVKKHISDGIFEENEGAVIFRGEKYGLHTRVFINSLGLPTYEAKELALAPTKYKDFPYDESLIITANEVNEYFRVLLKVLSLINPDLAKKTKHLSHGVVKLSSGKMSSRKGNVITAEWLLDEAKKNAKQRIQEAKHNSIIKDDKDQEIISDQVGVGAVKFALLKSSIGKDVEFDFDKSVSFEGISGPYLQYTYVRTQSLLEKVSQNFMITEPYKMVIEEKELINVVIQFSTIVEEAVKTLSPNMLCYYLYELAKHFNIFYQKYRIIDAPHKNEVNFRLALTALIGLILKQGLSFLGIAAPKRM